MLPIFAPRMYSSNYRKIFFEDSDIVDKLATAVWFEHTCFYVNFYRISQQGRFKPGQVGQLRPLAFSHLATRGSSPQYTTSSTHHHSHHALSRAHTYNTPSL